MPEKITIDGSAANEAAIKSYNAEHGTAIAIRQIKYLNNIVEQDHRGVKRVTRPMLGFKAFDAAQGTLVGIELMHMIKKKQMVVEAGRRGPSLRPNCSTPWPPNPPQTGQLPLHDLLSKICDKEYTFFFPGAQHMRTARPGPRRSPRRHARLTPPLNTNGNLFWRKICRQMSSSEGGSWVHRGVLGPTGLQQKGREQFC